MKIVARLLVCALAGLPLALLFGYMALDHNPQGEYADPMTGAYTNDLYSLVGITWGFIALPLMAAVLLYAIVRHIIDRRHPPS